MQNTHGDLEHGQANNDGCNRQKDSLLYHYRLSSLLDDRYLRRPARNGPKPRTLPVPMQKNSRTKRRPKAPDCPLPSSAETALGMKPIAVLPNGQPSKDRGFRLPLSSSPLQIGGFFGVVEPPLRATLHAQGVGKEAHPNPERQDDNRIDQRPQHARLEIADPARQALPGFPEALQHSYSLEQRIDERRNRRALRQDEQHAEQKQHHNHRHHPPAFIAQQERQHIARNPQTPLHHSKEAHHSSLTRDSLLSGI